MFRRARGACLAPPRSLQRRERRRRPIRAGACPRSPLRVPPARSALPAAAVLVAWFSVSGPLPEEGSTSPGWSASCTPVQLPRQFVNSPCVLLTHNAKLVAMNWSPLHLCPPANCVPAVLADLVSFRHAFGLG